MTAADFATATAPLYPGPDPKIDPPRRIVVPPGAVDCHCHVIGLPPAYPLVAERAYTVPAAPPERYLALLDALGMTHGVLIQVSVHGTDNTLMVEALKANPWRLRGIAVVDTDVSDADLRRLADAGVVGLRLNVLFGGGIGFDALETLTHRIAPLGWHLQFLLDARILPELEPRLRKLPVPFVIDHMGHMPASLGVEEPGFRTLVRLLEETDCWVKLSGAYRVTATGRPYADTVPIARALVAARPDRLVWGTDWPHVAMPDPLPKPGELLDLLADWLPDEAQRNAVLTTNAHRLYGFGDAAARD